MNKLFWLMVFYVCSLNSLTAADFPEKYIGEWHIDVDSSQKGFPWWQQVKYPKVLIIKSQYEATFIDQFDDKCEIPRVNYDENLNIAIIRHCGIGAKSEGVISPMHLMFVNGDIINGEVRTYKYLFRWHGKRVNK